MAFCVHGDVGFSMKNSVASMITPVSGHFLKDFGNCHLTSSRVGQRSRVPSKIFASKHTHVVTILQTEASETPNMSPSCRFRTRKRSPQSTKRYFLSQKDVSVFQAFFRHVILIVWLAILLFVPVFNFFLFTVELALRFNWNKQGLVCLYKI